MLVFVPPQEGNRTPVDPRGVEDWLQTNDAILRSFGSISAIGRRTAIRPATKLGLPNYFDTGNAWENRTNAVKELVASLSEAQWKQIASPQGLAYGSLTGEQPTLWEIAVPNPFVVDRVTTAYDKREVAPENTRTLSDAERRQIRLRIKLTGTVSADYDNGRGSYPVVFKKNREEKGSKGTPFLALRETGAYRPPQEKREDGLFAYGQYLAQYQPNRPRTLPESFVVHLSSAAVAVPAEEAPSTAGKLLDEISSAIGIKLYAGAKFRDQPVTIVGWGNIAASSLLHALLFATDNTVRVLPPSHSGEPELYVVAPGSEPVGRTAGYIADWYSNAQMKGYDSDLPDRMKANNPAYLLRFDADDPASVSDAVREKYIKSIEQKIAVGEPATDVRLKIAMSDLPSTTQQEVYDLAKQHVKMSEVMKTNYRLRLDPLTWYCAADFSYLLPGTGDFAGEVGSDPVGDISYLLSQTNTTKESIKGRVVALSAATAEEAQELLRGARAAGAKEVWLQASSQIVGGAVGAAGTMPVRGVVSLLGIREDTPQELPREENLYGRKSREWLVPDEPSVIDHAVERVRRMAAIPGIAGIVLRDTVPPGYRGVGTADDDGLGEPATRNLGGNGVGLGYSLAHRRTFLLEKGQDPADIIESLPVDLAWQEDAIAMRSWQMWRHDRMIPLWESLQKTVAGKPVLLEGEASFQELGQRGLARMSMFTPWDTRQPKPPLLEAFTNAVSLKPQVSKAPGTIICIAGNPGVLAQPSKLLRLMKREDKPEETIWDLSDSRTPGTTERLRNLRSVP